MGSNNTNKLSPQELGRRQKNGKQSSNNTNKLSPQEPSGAKVLCNYSSNNTNKLSPQEQGDTQVRFDSVQIIQINLVLKNLYKINIRWVQFK